MRKPWAVPRQKLENLHYRKFRLRNLFCEISVAVIGYFGIRNEISVAR